MRLFLNILKWIAIVLAGLLLVLFSLSFLLSNKIVDLFLVSLNKEISTNLVVGKSNLSFIKRFPKASVELSGVTVFSSPLFDKSQFKKINTDTLLSANSAILEFSMTDLLKGNYKIQSIIIDNGRLNLFSDSSGGVNYDIYTDTSSTDDDPFVIDLEKIIISGIRTRYINTATSLDISGVFEKGRIKSRIAGDDIDFTCNTSLVIHRFDLYSASVKTNAALTVDLNLHESDSGIVFRKGSMKLEDFRFGLSGFISSADLMDLKVTGRNIDLARIKKYLPSKYISKFMEYSPSGIVKTECSIKGYMSRLQNPEINLLFSVEKGSILYSKSNISIKNLSFSGRFTNGEKRCPESNMLDIKNLKLTLGSASWGFDFRLSNFKNPSVDLILSGEIIPSELLKFISIPEIISSSGSFRLNLNLSGVPGKKENYSLSDFIDLNPRANIEFNSFGFNHRNADYSISDVDGNMMFSKNLWADNLVFTYKGQRFKVNGEFTNLPAWIAGRPVKIKAVADISAGNVNPPLLFGDSTSTGSASQTPFIFPSGIEADINFKVNNLVYNTFSAENISGKLIYKPGLLQFKSLNINALNGNAAGEFVMVQNRSKSFAAHGEFSFENLNVNQAFKSFKNFGQDFIVAENLKGTLTGKVSLFLPMDSMLNPDFKAIAAEGNYVLENGELINFEPVKSLSDYIELSELENISFSTLQNDFFIEKNYLAVPQMNIKSSAADFSVNGKHYFDYTYEYHVKIYLSELLSKKAKKRKDYSDNFGAIEEDGLGRTSIYLRITGNDEDLKVSYDLKAARRNVKQNLKNEGKNIKSILNQEYGWFKSDTTLKEEAAPRPKFRIQFSETDTATTIKDTSLIKQEKGVISRIFKKKKGVDKDF